MPKHECPKMYAVVADVTPKDGVTKRATHIMLTATPGGATGIFLATCASLKCEASIVRVFCVGDFVSVDELKTQEAM